MKKILGKKIKKDIYHYKMFN